MSLSYTVKQEVYDYRNGHLPNEDWYKTQFEFIGDEKLKEQLSQEFRRIRFAYKLYEGIKPIH